MLPERAFQKVGGRMTLEGGDGGGSSAPTQQTMVQTNIPEYAQPYVEGMLGAAQQQVYNIDDSGNITGIKPYQPYSSNVTDYFAPFSPMQLQAQYAASQLQTPSQFGYASDLAAQSGYGALGQANQANMLGQTALAYGETGAGYGAAGSQYGAAGARQAQEAAMQAQLQAQRYGQDAAHTGMQGLGYGSQAAGYGAEAAGMAGMGFGAGQQYAQQATSPEAMAAYMSPYQQNVTDYQKSQAIRDYNIAQQARKAQAIGAGAFGGSRQAIAESEAQRNLQSQLQGIEATGRQQAYQQAQQAQQFGANLGLQGLQAGYAGLGQGIQGAQAGIAGISPALQGYQTGLQGVGQQISAGQLGLAGTAQGMQGAQAGMAGAQAGLQGVQGAIGAGQYGLQGYGQGTQAAQALGQLGTQQLAAQQGVIGTQAQYGAQQQALQQQYINQAIQNYAMAQQYPQQQLAYMSGLLRGLPMQAATTSSYQAAPSTTSQLAGLGMAGLGAYGMYNAATRSAKGGTIKEKKTGLDDLGIYNAMKGVA